MAKEKTSRRELINLNSIIEQISPLLKSDALNFGKNITFELNYVPQLSLDEKEMRQLILNFVRNGLEATPIGKTVTIKTDMPDSKNIVLSISDEGSGIDERIIDKIGTPFITTKSDGTGLGLAICYAIAKRNNATIDFKTSSEGTTFFIRFTPPSNILKHKSRPQYFEAFDKK